MTSKDSRVTSLRTIAVRLIDGIPDVAAGAACMVALQAPELLPLDSPTTLSRLVMLEFAAIHCSGFMFLVWLTRWSMWRRAAYLGALTAAYSLVLGIVSLFLKDAWPLAVFWPLIANRALTMLVEDAPDAPRQEAVTHAWAGTTTLYAMLGGVGLMVAGDAGPAGFLVVGALYYTSVGLSEFTGWSWVFRWMQWSRNRR